MNPLVVLVLLMLMGYISGYCIGKFEDKFEKTLRWVGIIIICIIIFGLYELNLPGQFDILNYILAVIVLPPTIWMGEIDAK